eukprot:m.24010 g.24010  ORF g.24010 m.24010 type:complete len:202 (-) comp4203_c0_seq1:130-735(-)
MPSRDDGLENTRPCLSPLEVDMFPRCETAKHSLASLSMASIVRDATQSRQTLLPVLLEQPLLSHEANVQSAPAVFGSLVRLRLRLVEITDSLLHQWTKEIATIASKPFFGASRRDSGHDGSLLLRRLERSVQREIQVNDLLCSNAARSATDAAEAGAQARPVDSLESLRKTLAILEEVLGPDHPDTAATLRSIHQLPHNME